MLLKTIVHKMLTNKQGFTKEITEEYNSLEDALNNFKPYISLAIMPEIKVTSVDTIDLQEPLLKTQKFYLRKQDAPITHITFYFEESK